MSLDEKRTTSVSAPVEAVEADLRVDTRGDRRDWYLGLLFCRLDPES